MKKVPSGSHLTEAQVVLGHRNWDMGLTPHDVMQTEFEWATIRFQQAFERYCMQIAHISGLGELSFPELILLHVMGLQDGPITSGLLARQINAEGVANIQYSLRKLESYQLVAKTRVTGGNTQAYELTEKAGNLIKKYAHFRQRALTDQTKVIDAIDRRLAESTQLISMLTGIYDEAMRVSATYNSHVGGNETAAASIEN
jgi:predicted MarR family transcription regulator